MKGALFCLLLNLSVMLFLWHAPTKVRLFSAVGVGFCSCWMMVNIMGRRR